MYTHTHTHTDGLTWTDAGGNNNCFRTA